MNFLRFAIFAIMALLFAACSTTKQAPQLTRYEQHMKHDILDMKSVQNSEIAYDNKIKDTLSYNVCEYDEDGQVIRYPCDYDSIAISKISERIYYSDAEKGIEVKFTALYHPMFVLYLDNFETLGKVWTGNASPIIVRGDSSKIAYCASSNAKTCDYLMAVILVRKKFKDEQIVWSKTYDVLIDSNFFESFSTRDFINLCYGGHVKNAEENRFLPYEMCWSNGEKSIPCNLDSSIVNEMNAFAVKNNATLGSVSSTSIECGSDGFALESLLGKYICKSEDGLNCNVAYFQTFLNPDEKNPYQPWMKYYEYNLKTKKIEPCPESVPYDVFIYRWYYYDEKGNLISEHDRLF